MTDSSPEAPDAGARRAEGAVRGLESPRPDPAFRARLERDFVAGRLGRPRSLVLARPWYARPAWQLALAPLAVAALVWVGIAANRGPAWRVSGSQGEGFVSVDGRPVPAAHLEELAALLAPGARVRVTTGVEVELALPGTMVVQLTAGADFTLPETPGRWFARATRAELRTGEIRVATGPDFRGATLRVDTPEARVEVTGTTLAVICEPTGTCVCVHEGTVRVGTGDGAMAEVPAGSRRYVFNDGRPPEQAEIRSVEHVELDALRSRYRAP